MEKIRMWEVVSLLGIPAPPSGRSSYYVPCPCCDTIRGKKHLNINLRKEVFRCPRCGISGGIFDLYALYTGIPRDEVRKTLAEQLDVPLKEKKPKKLAVPQANTQYPLADVETRHAVYQAFLSRLSLATDHRENLLARGLTEQDIQKLEYKTTPVIGMEAIAKRLCLDGFRLAGIPGFYKDENGKWSFAQAERGILIPVRDPKGRIQGLQIRRDNVTRRKFRWVSSAERAEGCKAEGWTHVAGSVCQVAVLTEGAMKADVIHALTGLTVLAVPGVNALTQLELTLLELRNEGLTEIKTAFDMDFATNWHVQKGYDSLLNLLGQMGLQFGVYLWDPAFKGLDDYIW